MAEFVATRGFHALSRVDAFKIYCSETCSRIYPRIAILEIAILEIAIQEAIFQNKQYILMETLHFVPEY